LIFFLVIEHIKGITEEAVWSKHAREVAWALYIANQMAIGSLLGRYGNCFTDGDEA
jgi:hypothetical protein